MKAKFFTHTVYLALIKETQSSAQKNKKKLNIKRHYLGFTLLEVMVALAIFATAAMTLTKVAMQYTQATSHAILRTKAQFVALNEAALMEINREWLTGTASKKISQQGEMWQIDKRAEATVSANVQRIDIQVSLVNQETEQVEAGISSLVFFNHKMNESQ